MVLSGRRSSEPLRTPKSARVHPIAEVLPERSRSTAVLAAKPLTPAEVRHCMDVFESCTVRGGLRSVGAVLLLMQQELGQTALTEAELRADMQSLGLSFPEGGTFVLDFPTFVQLMEIQKRKHCQLYADPDVEAAEAFAAMSGRSDKAGLIPTDVLLKAVSEFNLGIDVKSLLGLLTKEEYIPYSQFRALFRLIRNHFQPSASSCADVVADDSDDADVVSGSKKKAFDTSGTTPRMERKDSISSLLFQTLQRPRMSSMSRIKGFYDMRTGAFKAAEQDPALIEPEDESPSERRITQRTARRYQPLPLRIHSSRRRKSAAEDSLQDLSKTPQGRLERILLKHDGRTTSLLNSFNAERETMLRKFRRPPLEDGKTVVFFPDGSRKMVGGATPITQPSTLNMSQRGMDQLERIQAIIDAAKAKDMSDALDEEEAPGRPDGVEVQPATEGPTAAPAKDKDIELTPLESRALEFFRQLRADDSKPPKPHRTPLPREQTSSLSSSQPSSQAASSVDAEEAPLFYLRVFVEGTDAYQDHAVRASSVRALGEALSRVLVVSDPMCQLYTGAVRIAEISFLSTDRAWVPLLSLRSLPPETLCAIHVRVGTPLPGTPLPQLWSSPPSSGPASSAYLRPTGSTPPPPGEFSASWAAGNYPETSAGRPSEGERCPLLFQPEVYLRHFRQLPRLQTTPPDPRGGSLNSWPQGGTL